MKAAGIILLSAWLLFKPGWSFLFFEREVNRYVKIVEDGISASKTYQTPTNANEYKPTKSGVVDGGAYDYVVVGAGTSGSVLAARLSEIRSASVLVLEAGEVEDEFVDIPGMHIYEGRTKYNWGYSSIPQNNSCLALKEERCLVPRGKALGGSSVINAMLYIRMRRQDFDAIEAAGNPGWGYSSVLPYFKKAEKCFVPDADRPYHGYSGPYDVSYHPEQSPQTVAFINANRELNVPVVDYNGRSSLGVSRLQTNVKNGKRVSTYRAYLEKVKYRRNIDIHTKSYVTKIKVNQGETSREVHYVRNGQSTVVRAKREIILSAGSIGSPQILMLSGIGPADHLKQLGIDVVKDLSVGDNYRDHPGFYGVQFATNATYVDKGVRQNVRDYLRGQGFYTVAGNIQSIGFYESPINQDRGNPDIELLQVPSPTLLPAVGMKDNDYASLTKDAPNNSTFMLMVIPTRVKSTGTLRLKSSDPFAYPLLNPGFFTDPEEHDLNTTIAMMGFLRQLEATKALKKIGTRLVYPNITACKDLKFDSREYWVCNIKQLSFSIYHPSSTCKMGPDPKKGAVVDAQFRVHGYRTLRVVDSSIIPEPYSAHPAANCVMFGEKAADVIKQAYYSN